jgi:hypothetical protein
MNKNHENIIVFILAFDLHVEGLIALNNKIGNEIEIIIN